MHSAHSAYTASFTLNLIKNSQADAWEGLRDVLQSGGKVCMLASIQVSMIEKYTFLETKNVVGVRNYIDVVEGMDAGHCRGGIMSGSIY